MPDPTSSVLDPIADALKAKLDAVGFDLSHKWAPRAADLGGPVSAVVEMPAIERTNPQEREDELGSLTWRVVFPVLAYFPFDDPVYGQAKAVAFVEAIVRAIDADPTLGGTDYVDETKVVEAGPPVIFEEESPPTIRYPLRVSVLAYVP